MHVNEDLLVVEVVDEVNRPVPPGTFGEKVLVTVLFNRTQPLIRYELSDRVRLSTLNCSCSSPFPLIDAVEGRSEELLRFPSLTGSREVSVHPLVLEHLLDRLPAAEWQVVQERDRLVVLLTGVKEGFDVGQVAGLVAGELTIHGAAIPLVEVHRVTAIPRGITGKASIVFNKNSR
jgi:phenylacetate-coenzyme A ligase PaaK-like adenylate-forming protein